MSRRAPQFEDFPGGALVRRLFALQFVRFGAVGATVTVCFMALNALFGRGFGWTPQLAFLAAYPPALGLHFLLNKLWTFGDRRTITARHVGEYLFAVVVTFLIQWPSFTLLQGLAHWPGWLAAGMANVIQMCASFLLLRRRVFGGGGAGEATEAAGARQAWHRLMLLLAVLGTAALLVWTSLGGWEWPAVGPVQGDYYNLLASGFRKGSLALDVRLPPGGVLHDASYYRGHYYIYFGPVPVVVLFLPFHWLTGHDLPFVLGSLGFTLCGFALAAWLWTRVVRDHFPAASLVTKWVGVVGLGTVGYQLVLARRVSLWEGPIAAGHAFAMLFVTGAYLALQGRSRRRWLAVASLALALAVGCRPSLIAAAPALAWLAWSLLVDDWVGPARTRMRHAFATLVAGAVPFAVVLAGLLVYNYARFGNALEFGMRYQLSGQDEAAARHWSLSYVGYNLETYFLRPPQWGRYFPFLHPVRGLVAPAGYYGIEYVYGVLIICPLIWWVACAPAVALGRVRPLARFARVLAAMACCVLGLMLANYTAAARYLVDFLPWWLWLACLGWAGLERRLQSAARPMARRMFTVAFGLTAAVSFGLAFCASVELHGLLPLENPSAYAALSGIFDRPAFWWERATGYRAGPLEMNLTFADRNSGSVEPLVIMGVGYETDYLYLFFESARVVRIGYAANGHPALLSGPLAVEPGRSYPLKVECGGLYPPLGHPALADWTAAEVESVKRWVRVDFDGRPVLNEAAWSHDASADALRIGWDVPKGPYGERFSGRITRVSREGLPKFVRARVYGGDFRIELTLPQVPAPNNRPLLEAGRPGRADLVGLRQSDPGHIRFTYESWSHGLWTSGPVGVPASRDLSVRIRLGPLLGLPVDSPVRALRRSVVIWSDGVAVWWRKTYGPIEDDPPWVIGQNALGSSAMAESLGGRLRDWSRGPGVTWRAGPMAAAILEVAGGGSGVDPVVSTGERRRGDLLALEYVARNRARLVYLHTGASALTSPAFDWRTDRVHGLRVDSPGLRSLDRSTAPSTADGPLAVDLDGIRRWARAVPFYPATSASVAIGLNPAGVPGVAAELSAVLVDAAAAAEPVVP